MDGNKMKTLPQLKTRVGKAAQGANIGHVPCAVMIAVIIVYP
jgi:hypothetical protein